MNDVVGMKGRTREAASRNHEPGRRVVGDLVAGERVGSATVERLIAKSGWGAVYRGSAKGVPVAIKVLRAPHDALQERAARESSSQKQVKHPAVAALIESGRHRDGRIFLISEWVEGPTLAAMLRNSGPLSWSQLRPLVEHLTYGLQAIHAAGLIHRDIKPANIIVPSADRAVIVDFGLAMAIGDRRLTADGKVIGSPAYMSPEQTRSADLDARTDLYSLGVVIYEALTGTVPYRDKHVANVLLQHSHGELEPPRERAPDQDIPQPVEDLCMWLLARDRSRRVPNARVVLLSLQASPA